MLLFQAIILLLIGLTMIINPKVIYKITDKWKSYFVTDPTGLYYFSVRIGGVIFIILGMVSLLYYYLVMKV
ncbi:MAG: hypothetical protein K0S01_3722 [Herbinix sp.]|jgi:hypothetical protein|nr:hypothetical protein [Herbinix sp.]